jgi:RNA-directed DNA polymerase
MVHRLPLPAWLVAPFRTPSATPSPGEQHLAHILDMPAEELASIRLGRRYAYRSFTIRKPDGRERHILAPTPALKALGRKLLHRYLACLPVHPAATAFVAGGSIAVNARRHAGQALVATLDLADFFASTSARRVRAFFRQQGWRGPALSVLMRLCVYRDGLPQGAPTSPCLSNLVNFPLDEALAWLAHASNAVYTRYGDDLTFSWSNDDLPARFEAGVRGVLLRAGYRAQPRKDWRVYRARQEPRVTGLVLKRNGQVSAPWAIRVRMAWLRWRAMWRGDAPTLARLRGYQAFLSDLNTR